MRIGIVAAEPSGDHLAAGLMAELSKQYPEMVFEGIGGPLMQQQGMESWYPMQKLSHMGLAEVLAHIPELLRIRHDLLWRWRKRPPDLFIGIDAPDFNLHLETQLKLRGTPTVHYVSPTVWAWRQKRVKKIRRAANLVLCIFPFEADYLRQQGIEAEYVGQPLAQQYPLEPDPAAARAALGIGPQRKVLALLPGSRIGEVQRLSRPFLLAALRCRDIYPDLTVVTPLITEKTRELFERARRQYAPDLDLKVLESASGTALTAADVALVASGTATFEALLCKCPMVVGYKLNWLTYQVIMGMKMLKTDKVAMANLLSDEALAPEFIQNKCEAGQLAPALLDFFADKQKRQKIAAYYTQVHESLMLNTNEKAANAVKQLVEQECA